MSALERFDKLDLAWLQIDRDDNPAQFVALLVLASPVSRAELLETLTPRLARIERMGQHVVPDSAGAVWERGPFHPETHVIDACLPREHAPAALAALVGELAGQPLDPRAPLWQIHHVAHYLDGSALIVRMHQCIADSIALTGIVQSLTVPSPATPTPVGDEGFDANYFARLYAPLTDAMIEGIKLSGAFWARFWSVLLFPQQLFDHTHSHTALTLEIGKLKGLANDGPVGLKTRLGGVKRAAWSPRLATEQMEAVARTRQAPANVVLIAVLTAALHEELQGLGHATDGVMLRALMPVNLREESMTGELGNRCGLVPLDLPVGAMDAGARLRAIQQSLESLGTDSARHHQTLGIFSLLGQTSPSAQDQVLELLSQKTSALLCPVPAAQTPRYLCGARIAEQMYWSAGFGTLGLSLSIVHYDGAYQIGVLADTAILPDPASLIARLMDALKAFNSAKPRARRRKPA